MAYKEMYFVSDSYGNLTVHPEVLSITQNSNNTRIKLCGNFTDEALVWATIIQTDGKTLPRRAVMLTAETIEIGGVEYRVYSYRLVQDDTKTCPSATGVWKISFSIEDNGEEVLTTNEYSLTIMRSNISAVTNTPADTIDAVATKVNQNTADIAELESGMASIDLNGKLDKITGGTGVWVYAHESNSQFDIVVSPDNEANSVIRRDGNGRAGISNPSEYYHIANKSYVDITIAEAVTHKLGEPNGIAELNGDGKIPSWQLPSYVDDVIEVANFAALPETGEPGKIYVTKDTNLTYRWSGSAYVEISKSLALGDTSTTAYRGDRGTELYAFTSPAFESGQTLQSKLDFKADKTELITPWITGAVVDNAFTANCNDKSNYILNNSQDVALTITNAYNGAHMLVAVHGGVALTLPAGCVTDVAFDWTTVEDDSQYYIYEFVYNGTVWEVTRNVYNETA